MTVIEIVMTAMLFACIGSIFGLRERISRLESSERTLWQAVNRIGDESDQLRMRIWDIEHKRRENESGIDH